MKVIALLRDQALEEFIEVANKARLELHGSNPGCRSGDKDQGLPFFQSACGQRLLQCRRQVMHIAVAFGLNHVFRCFDHADEF